MVSRWIAYPIIISLIFSGTAKAEAQKSLLDPTSFDLSTTANEATLHLFNNEEFPVEWSAKPFKWNQTISGKDDLANTSVISTEPKSVQLAPHTGQEIQIKYQGDAVSDVEKTFRIVLTSNPITQSGIAVSYTHSLPIFVTSPKFAAKLDLNLSATNAEGQLVLKLLNSGTAHDFAQEISITGRDAHGERVFAIDRSGWYLLSDSSVAYRAYVSAADCKKSIRFYALVKFRSGHEEQTTLSSTLACSPDPTVQTSFEREKGTAVVPVPASTSEREFQ